MKDILVQVSETLRQARIDSGLTQQQVADKIETGVNYVKKYETGRSSMTFKQFQRIAKTIGAKDISITLHF